MSFDWVNDFKIEFHVFIRPIYMVVLASAVEGSFDVKTAQCN